MGIEIERKFLIRKTTGEPPWRKPGTTSYTIQQGYLQKSRQAVVRIRIRDDAGFITIKGETKNIARKEFEYEIPCREAEEMLLLCPEPPIVKQRYEIIHKGFTWEIDVFSGDNQGLMVAEIELNAPDQHFDKPSWVGREVTHEARYCNACLATRPFCNWQEAEK